MAEELDDGEFWLPSQFLTDDDILSDFKSHSFPSALGSGSGSTSDLGSLATDAETSDDDYLLLPGSTRKDFSGSPQSTLCRWATGPVSPQKEQAKEKDDVGKSSNNATLDLLNKAADEVAKMKMRSEISTTSTGTGFFDCSNSAKGLSCPPQRPPPYFPPPFYAYPQFRRFPPRMMWGPVQFPPPQQLQNNINNSKTNKTNNSNGNNNRPLGLPPSAWPPLPGQAPPEPQAQPPQPQPQAQPNMGMFMAPMSASVGTGVFLPRRVTTTATAVPKKKSDGNVMKTKNNKGSQKRSPRPTKTNNDEFQLPSEWVY